MKTAWFCFCHISESGAELHLIINLSIHANSKYYLSQGFESEQ